MAGMRWGSMGWGSERGYAAAALFSPRQGNAESGKSNRLATAAIRADVLPAPDCCAAIKETLPGTLVA